MTINALPRDPLRNYQFRIGFDVGLYVAGVKRVSGLNLSIAANEVWSGGNSLHRYANPDKVTWDPITLEQGLAVSDDLEKWAKAALDFLRTGQRPDSPLKRNLYIDIWDPYVHESGGQVKDPSSKDRFRSYVVLNAWISRYQALPQLDAMSNEVALLSVELVHEGWCPAPAGFRHLPSTGAPIPSPGATAHLYQSG